MRVQRTMSKNDVRKGNKGNGPLFDPLHEEKASVRDRRELTAELLRYLATSAVNYSFPAAFATRNAHGAVPVENDVEFWKKFLSGENKVEVCEYNGMGYEVRKVFSNVEEFLGFLKELINESPELSTKTSVRPWKFVGRNGDKVFRGSDSMLDLLSFLMDPKVKEVFMVMRDPFVRWVVQPVSSLEDVKKNITQSKPLNPYEKGFANSP